MSKTLYVPVMLDVLLVGDEDRGYADVDYDYSLLDEETLFGDMISNRGFGEKKQLAGAHLQWTMPDALLHGVKQEDGSISFPTLPNRFLIQRLKMDGADVSWKCWKIRSDFVTNDSAKTPEGMRKTVIPALEYCPQSGCYQPAGDDGKMYAFVGSVRPFGEEETEKEKWKLPMTAVGLSDPLTTAYYPLSKTVFGFYDSLAEGEGLYTYLVSGYYEDITQDPLHENAAEKMKEFGWRMDSEEEVECCLMYGISHGVAWKGRTHSYARIPEEEVRIDIGNTSMETMASLLASSFPEKEGMERLFHGLPYGLLAMADNDSRTDTLIEMEEQLHATQFNQINGGMKWVLRMQQEKGQTSGEWELDEEQYQKMVSLNKVNDRKHRCREDLESASQELYAFWYQYVQFKVAAPQYGKLPEMKARVVDLVEQIQRQKQAYANFEQAVTKQKQELDSSLKKKKLYLEETPEGFYYEPVPPVLMLSGEGVRRSFRQGHQGSGKEGLAVTTSLVSELNIVCGSARYMLLASEVRKELSIPDTFPDTSARLLGECLLCGQEMIPFLIEIVFRKYQGKPSEEEVRAAQEKTACSPLAKRVWEQPWNPLLLLWEVSVSQTDKIQDRDATFASFHLEEIDWEMDRRFEGKEQTFQGLSLLTPHGVTQMSRGCRQVMKKWDRKWGALEGRLKELEMASVLSQQMAGFYEAFSARSDMPMLPILSPDEETKMLAKEVTQCLDGYYHMPVLGGEDSPFLPVRGGTLNLKRLWLIDSFGQYKEVGIFSHNVHISESLQGENEKEVLLRPRFLQPVRIEFEWMSAEHEDAASFDAASTPVTGFLVPVFLDHCIYVYDNQGRLSGAIMEGKDQPCWQPGMGNCITAEEIANPYLKNFVKGLLTGKTEDMRALMRYLRKYLSELAVDEHMEIMSQCFGRTLALCRAKVALSGCGRTRKQLIDDTCTTREYEKENVLVRLGDERRISNGLLGYAEETGQPCEILHVMESVGEQKQGYLDSCHDLPLSLAQGERSLLLLMLPEGEISLRAGFVPAMKVSLQKEMYESRREKIQRILKLKPHLSAEGKITLPQAQMMGEDWQFCYRDGKEERQKQTESRGLDFREEEKWLVDGFLMQKERKGETHDE